MTSIRFAVPALVLVAAAAAAAGQFDGSTSLECAAYRGHDCLPGMTDCKLLQPETHKAPLFDIDFTKKEVRSPFRTAVLTVTHTTDNSESLVLQGADLLFAWSALINKATGALTISIADRKGAYVVFGKCKAATAKSR